MPSDEPLDDRCGAECRSGSGYCTQYPVNGSDRCRMHGGTNDGPSEGNDNAVGHGAPENNGNSETHGLRSNPGPYYHRQSAAEQDRIDEWAASWARRAGYDGLGFDKIFQTHAVKLHQIESGDSYIGDEGVVATRIVDRTEAGEPIEQDEENPALLYQSRALKDIVRFLKDFGVLDDPESQQAEAAQSVAEILGGSQ